MTNDELNEIVERVRQRIIEDPANEQSALMLLSMFEGMSAEDKEKTANVFGEAFWGIMRSRALNDAKQWVNVRWLENGSEVTTNGAGTVVGLTGGKGQFDIANFLNAELRINSASNARQVDIRTTGGLDCMADFIVSECWATEVAAGRGTEGQSFKTATGCTVKFYSTVAAAAAQATIDIPWGSTGVNDTAVIFICPGVYAENNIIVDSDQRWYGAGIDSTVIGSLAAGLTNPNINVGSGRSGSKLWVSNLTIRAPASSAVNGVRLDASCELIAYDSEFEGGSTYVIGVTSTTQRITLGAGCTVRKWGISGVQNDCIVSCFGTRFVASGGGQTAIQTGEHLQIAGGAFESYAVAVRITGVTSASQVRGADFIGNTTDVLFADASGLVECQMKGNSHYGSTTAYDLSALDGTSNLNNDISGNVFDPTVATAFKFGASTAVRLQADIHDNIAGISTALYSGTVPVGVRMWDNKEGYVFKDTMRGNALWGLVGVAAFSLTLYWPAFSVFFGNTKVNVAAGNFTYPSLVATTYYVSVDSAGVLTANTAAAFPANQFPIAIITTSTNQITAIEYYDGILRTSASGAGAAGNNEPFVTHAASANLTNERVATAGSGIAITNAGTDGGALTWALAPLTALYDQSGAYNWVNRGGNLLIANSKKLSLYSDNSATPSTLLGQWDAATGHIGIGTTVDINVGILNAEVFTAPATAKYGAQIIPTFAHSGASSLGHYGAYVVPTLKITAAATLTGSHHALASGIIVDDESAGGTVNDVAAWAPVVSTLGTVTVVTARAIHVHDAAVIGGSIGTYYGIDIPVLSAATLSIGMRNLSTSRLVGAVTVGADAAVTAGLILDITGNAGIKNEGELRLYDSGSSNYIGIRSNNARTTDLVYVLPVTDPTAGQILSASAPVAGVVTLTWAADATGAGSVATDTIWDAKGDLAVGTGANTAVAVTVGANDTILMADSTQAAGVKWVASAAPVAVGTANSEGTSDDYSRASHVHAHEAAHINHDTTWAAKGDLIVATANDTAQVLTVGSNNKVVIAASGETTGLKYDYVYHEVTVTVENPTASENIVVRQFTQAVTIDVIQAVVIGGTSVTIDPEHGSTITTATKLLSAAEVVASASTTGEHIGGTGTAMAASFNDNTLAAGDFLRLETTAISGTPTQLSVTFRYRLT